MSFVSMILAARAALANRRERRRAYGELTALDDRSLADIGLHRTHIPAVAEGLHDAVQFDSAPSAAFGTANRRDAGLSSSLLWLHRV